jgi:hypothetical protein
MVGSLQSRILRELLGWGEMIVRLCHSRWGVAGDGPRGWEENVSLADSRWLLCKLRHSPLRKPSPTFILVWFCFRFSQLSLKALSLLLCHRQLQFQHMVICHRDGNRYCNTTTKLVEVSTEETVQNKTIHWEIIYVHVQHISSCV